MKARPARRRLQSATITTLRNASLRATQQKQPNNFCMGGTAWILRWTDIRNCSQHVECCVYEKFHCVYDKSLVAFKRSVNTVALLMRFDSYSLVLQSMSFFLTLYILISLNGLKIHVSHVIMPRPKGAGIKRWWSSSVCLSVYLSRAWP